MASPNDAPLGSEERRAVLLAGAAHGRTDVVARALDEERQDPHGNVAALLDTRETEEDSQNSALHLACWRGHVDVVRMLLLRGADASALDAAGRTTFSRAKDSSRVADVRSAFEAELFKRAASGEEEGVRQLLAAGLDAAQCEQGGQRPSHWAGLFGHADLALRLEAAEQGFGFAASSEEKEAADADGAMGLPDTPEENDVPPPPPLASAEKAESAPPMFPLVWPLVRSRSPLGGRFDAISNPGAPLDGPAVALSLVFPLRLELPLDFDVRSVDAIREPLENALRATVAAAAKLYSSSWGSPRSHIAVPAAQPMVVPCFLGSVVSTGTVLQTLGGTTTLLGMEREKSKVDEQQHERDKMNEDDAEEIDAASQATRDSGQASAVIKVTLDRQLGIQEGAFRITIAPGCWDRTDKWETNCRRLGATGPGGHVEVTASDEATLKASLEVVCQIICHHSEIDPLARELRVPAAVVEDGPTLGCCSFQEPAGIFLNVWSLEEEALVAAMRRLSAWRVGRLYVPMLAPTAAGATAASVHLRRIFDLRCIAAATGVTLVPLLTTRAAEPLTVARAQELAQFGRCGRFGLRIQPEIVKQPALFAQQVLLRLLEAHCLAAEVLGHRAAHMIICLPADNEELLHRVCEAAQKVDFGSRLLIAVEVSYQGELTAGDLAGRSSRIVAAYGMPCVVFVLAAVGLRAAGTLESGGVRSLPPLVWPGRGVRARAAGIGDVVRTGRVEGACGAIVEVPVYGSPWSGPGAQCQRSWCELTAFLAAGLAQGPDVHIEALSSSPGCARTDGASANTITADGASCDRLGAVLTAQLLNVPTCVGAPSIPLALALWGGNTDAGAPPSGESNVPPPALLHLFFEMLEGRLAHPQLEDAADFASAWYLQLKRRKQLLRTHLDAVGTSGNAVHIGKGFPLSSGAVAVPHLGAALLGLEWLLMVCKLLLAVLKHAWPKFLNSALMGSLLPLREVLKAVPPPMMCDIRNTFLRLVDSTIDQSPTGVLQPHEQPMLEDVQESNGPAAAGARDGAHREAALRILWDEGLRIGAALNLEPWISFEVCDGSTQRRKVLEMGRARPQ